MNYQDFPSLLTEEKAQLENGGATKHSGQVYVYLSSGPELMIKIGKGLNGLQRISKWLEEYPPSWRKGRPVIIVSKLNQSTAETALHRFFKEQRVSKEEMFKILNIDEWSKLPDGASEWFKVDRKVWSCFRSIGIDLYEIYNGYGNTENVEYEVNETSTSVEPVIDVEGVLYNEKGLGRWSTFSDSRELVPYINALLGGNYIGTGSNTKYMITNTGGDYGNIYISRDNQQVCSILFLDYNKFSYIDILTGECCSYTRYKSKGERRDSRRIKTDLAKTVVSEICDQIKKYEYNNGEIRTVPSEYKITYPNGTPFSDRTTFVDSDETHVNPAGKFIEIYKSRYHKFMNRLRSQNDRIKKYPTPKVDIQSVSSVKEGNWTYRITIGQYTFRYNVPYSELIIKGVVNPDHVDVCVDGLYDIMRENLSDKIVDGVFNNYTEEEVSRHNVIKLGGYVVFGVVFTSALIASTSIIGSIFDRKVDLNESVKTESPSEYTTPNSSFEIPTQRTRTYTRPKSACELWAEANPTLADRLQPGDRCYR